MKSPLEVSKRAVPPRKQLDNPKGDTVKQDTIHVQITGDASPAIREIRRAEAALRRVEAQTRQDPPLAYWRGVKAGLRFARAMESIRRSLKGGA